MQTLKFGATGDEVGQLHQALIEAGYTVDASELTTGKFLGSTALAVRQFQAAHGLTADQIVGPATWQALQGNGGSFKAPGWKYDASQVPANLRPVTDAAVSQIGVCEVGSSNIVPGDPYGVHGIPWCAAFLSWCFGRYAGGSPFGMILSAYKMMEWGKAHGAILGPGDKPQPGDIWVIIRGDLHGHVEVCVSLLPDGTMCCVGGNSGNAVRGNLRTRTSSTCLVRPVSASKAAPFV